MRFFHFGWYRYTLKVTFAINHINSVTLSVRSVDNHCYRYLNTQQTLCDLSLKYWYLREQICHKNFTKVQDFLLHFGKKFGTLGAHNTMHVTID